MYVKEGKLFVMETQALVLAFERLDSYSKAISKNLPQNLAKLKNKTAKISEKACCKT